MFPTRPDVRKGRPAPTVELVEEALWACDLRDGRTLPPGVLNDARNVRYPTGRPETRKGVVKPGWANRTTAGSDLVRPYGDGYGATVFRDPTGTVDWQIIAADGYAWRTRTYNQSVQIPLPPGVRLLSRCKFVQAFNKLFVFRGRYLAPLRMTSFDDGFEDLLEHWNSSDIWAEDEEVFYGPFIEVSTPVLLGAGELTSAATTATVTHANHDLDTGDSITIFGAAQAEYNGTYTITVTGDNTFTYTFAGSATTPATGTIYYVKSGLTRAGNTATVVTTSPHGYVTGADITISGAASSAYNGRVNITVLDEYTFTYFVAGAPATPDVGTIVCSNMAHAYRAEGTTKSVTSITRASQTATVTLVAHGFSNGDTVTIAGADQAEYNITAVIANVAADTFDYTVAGSPATPATGTITVRVHKVLAGRSPDTHPTEWTRIYDILPNAHTALYTNNRLLVATAYSPGTTDYADASVSYTKVDFLVATDIQDEIHFDFADEFRINQGSADEIVDLAKWSQDVVVIWKNSSWYVLSGVALDLADLVLDERSRSYGLTAPGAWAEAGDNIVFMAGRRGLVNIRQSESGKLIGLDVPMSAPIQKLIDRIDWTLASGIRLANWNSHLYAAVPLTGLDVAAETTGNNALLVFSFESAQQLGDWQQGWMPLDTGTALNVLDWFKLPLDGLERLFYLSVDGWVNLMEESDRGDQVEGTLLQPRKTYEDPQGLTWEETDTRWKFRAQGSQLARLQTPLGADIALETFNPRYSVTAHFEGVNKQTTLATDVTRSLVDYFRPWNATPWDPSNANADHETPYREDYRVSFRIGDNVAPTGETYGPFFEQLLELGVDVFSGRSFYYTDVNDDGALTYLMDGAAIVQANQTVFIPDILDYLLRGVLADQVITAQIYEVIPEINFTPGLRCLLHQEQLIHFRMSGRQGRSVAIEVTNNQGRIRWQGIRTHSRAGRARKGVQV